jgi:chromosome segregation ATPase
VEPEQGSKSPQEIEAEVAETREQLGETVAALAEKTDVKRQAKAKVQDTKQAAQEKATETAETAKQKMSEAPERAGAMSDRVVAAIRANPVPAVAGAVAALAIVVVLRRRS